MWFLKSKKALHGDLIVTLNRGFNEVSRWVNDYEDAPEESRSCWMALMNQMDELINQLDDIYETYNRKQLHILNVMFNLVLKAKKCEVALLKSIESN